MKDDTLLRYTHNIEDYLHRCFLESVPQIRLYESMRYSLLAGGKRLRPVLTQAFCELCGGEAEDALAFGSAVEMIHTYSLIHDDLPCMDNDDYRRGKLTNHRVYGEALAVLAGDGLLTHAFRRLTMAELPTDRILRAVSILADCAGEDGMVGGQVLDMAAEERECTAAEVHAIQSRKTGALISAACQLGVVAAGGTDEQLAAAREYAESLGLAFQIQDDILDVIGDAQKLGKATGVDGNKNTFVRIYGIDTCREMVRTETDKAIAALSVFDSPHFLIDLARRLIERDH